MTLIKQSLCILALLVISSLAAAKCGDNWREIRTRLANSKRRWARMAPSPSCYNMTIEKQCFCPAEYIGPHDLQIVKGKIQNTTMYTQDLPTVNGLFNLVKKYCVKNCPKSGAEVCKVRFDGVYGYVKELEVDISTQIIDEEIRYYVTDLNFCKK
ncbi:hypothetical protein MPSEU_000855700 [Mayamaea pseudoterrestris]|nr:hypothetical protein MPSEU_000855700 [Mayamaea pseudoterrestris]